jgi:hypothetical protein
MREVLATNDVRTLIANQLGVTAPLISGIEIANGVHKSGSRLDAIVIGNARFVPSRRKLGSFFEPDLLKK